MTSADAHDISRVTEERLRALLETLTGQPLPLRDEHSLLRQVAESISEGQTLGHSQFNELLLNVGYDRVDSAFFLYLCDPDAIRAGGNGSRQIGSTAQLIKGINAFRELALLLYGNVKFGFKALAQDSERLSFFIKEARRKLPEDEFRSRHDPLVRLKDIAAKDAHLLGYISGAEVEANLGRDPDNDEYKAAKRYRDEVVGRGQWNHNVYLTFDHLDVYVATSMREKHEFSFVKEFMIRMEESAHIRDLKLRLFDPTAAYCADRLDKGLAEALMLKRAACTVYLAQESDTLGKDSELASTLAQGKPVIAFVPETTDAFWAYLKETFFSIYGLEVDAILLRILRIYSPVAAWENSALREHLSGTKTLDTTELETMARLAVQDHYNKRARVLKETHPLGLQTNLSTGVANGVLVVRHINECAQLVRQILLNEMQFTIEDSNGYVMLRENISGCIFRVMTGDKLLTNSFWNFYNI